VNRREAQLFGYERWLSRIPEIAPQYAHAQPFRHLVLDDFPEPTIAQIAHDKFPRPDAGEWIQYLHFNERKLGRSNLDSIPPLLRAIIEELNAPRFVALLGALTGIDGLRSDDSLHGGGLHQTERGGHLNIHADFTVHPHRPRWRRRLNLLLYLNQDWRDEYGGHLELWDRRVQRCHHRIAPVFNRAVLFNTTHDAFHGHPEPLACPEGITRKSIALYYFTEEPTPVRIRSTEYRARPGEGLRAIPIYLDKMALRAYDRVKRRFRFSDRFVSGLLKLLAGR